MLIRLRQKMDKEPIHVGEVWKLPLGNPNSIFSEKKKILKPRLLSDIKDGAVKGCCEFYSELLAWNKTCRRKSLKVFLIPLLLLLLIPRCILSIRQSCQSVSQPVGKRVGDGCGKNLLGFKRKTEEGKTLSLFLSHLSSSRGPHGIPRFTTPYSKPTRSSTMYMRRPFWSAPSSIKIWQGKCQNVKNWDFFWQSSPLFHVFAWVP